MLSIIIAGDKRDDDLDHEYRKYGVKIALDLDKLPEFEAPSTCNHENNADENALGSNSPSCQTKP